LKFHDDIDNNQVYDGSNVKDGFLPDKMPDIAGKRSPQS